MSSPVHVTSEIGRLRRVLVHEPGPEVDRMVPAMMEELLFDDILFGERARDEHRRFKRVLQVLGVETLEASTLLAEALAGEAARTWILETALHSLSPMLREEMRAAPPEQLTAMLVGGVRPAMAHRGSEVEDLYEIPPLPNWCFQRDRRWCWGRRCSSPPWPPPRASARRSWHARCSASTRSSRAFLCSSSSWGRTGAPPWREATSWCSRPR